MRVPIAAPFLALTTVLACVSDVRNPVSPAFASSQLAISPSSWGPETPPFNDEIILRDVTGAGGFGHVKFRQPKDADRIVYLDTWVRDLQPNTRYQLRHERERRLHGDKLAHLGGGYGSPINHHGFPWHWWGRPVPQPGGVPGRFDIRHSLSGNRAGEPGGRIGERLLPVCRDAVVVTQ